MQNNADSAEAPVGGVDISANELLRDRMETNIDYLLTAFDVDHLLAPFRHRAGNASASWGSRAPVGFWDSDLLGSNAGRFLMGAGNTLRWIENAALRKMMDDVVDGIADCKNASGYIMAYEPAGFMHSEQGDYGRRCVPLLLALGSRLVQTYCLPLRPVGSPRASLKPAKLATPRRSRCCAECMTGLTIQTSTRISRTSVSGHLENCRLDRP